MEKNEGDIQEIPRMDFSKAFQEELEDKEKWFLDINGFEGRDGSFHDKLHSILDLAQVDIVKSFLFNPHWTFEGFPLFM
jgi:hypothetical protein